MTRSEMVVVHVEDEEPKAHIVAGFLQAQGIEARISEDDAGDQLPSLERTQGVRVFVPLADAERARRLLREREAKSAE